MIEELQAAKKSGLATGQERVCFGTNFLQHSSAVRSVVLMPNRDGDMTIGFSCDAEKEWVGEMSAIGNDSLNRVDPAQAGSEDPVALARRLGFDKRVAELESEHAGSEDPVALARRLGFDKRVAELESERLDQEAARPESIPKRSRPL